MLFLQGTGIILGVIILAAVSVVVTLLICFISSWQLSFVLLLAFPFLFLTYRLGNKLLHSSGAGNDDDLETSTQFVIESVTNMKTVISLGAQKYFIESVSFLLHSHMMLALLCIMYYVRCKKIKE